jgi:hypothetical protein
MNNEPLCISCDDCTMRDTDACDDCVVTFLCGPPGEPVRLEPVEAQALRLLTTVGLAPALRHQARDGAPGRPTCGATVRGWP